MDLYHIEENLINILNLLDEQGGEFTPEQEQELITCQEDFAEKIEDYYHVLTKITNDVAECKNEENRIKELRKSRENKVEKLKSILLDAVRRFGNQQKNGVISFDGSTFRLSTRNSEAVNIDEERIKTLIQYIKSYLEDIPTEVIEDDTQELPVEGMLGYINNLYKAEYDDNGGNPILFKEYTINDLKSLNLRITIDFNLMIY